MARNSEKHFVGLNRVFLEKQWDREKELKRPPLHTLQTADEVRQWIPSITKEIEYCLNQLSGMRKHDYTKAKYDEFEERVSYLQKEHKKFIRKVFELDKTQQGIPWQPRKYTSKRKHELANSKILDSQDSSDQNKLVTGENKRIKRHKKIALNVLSKTS